MSLREHYGHLMTESSSASPSCFLSSASVTKMPCHTGSPFSSVEATYAPPHVTSLGTWSAVTLSMSIPVGLEIYNTSSRKGGF